MGIYHINFHRFIFLLLLWNCVLSIFYWIWLDCTFTRRRNDVLFHRLRDVVVQHDSVQSPAVVSPRDLLTHRCEKTLRIEEPSHPEDVRSPVEQPAGQLRVTVQHVSEPESNRSRLPRDLTDAEIEIFYATKMSPSPAILIRLAAAARFYATQDWRSVNKCCKVRKNVFEFGGKWVAIGSERIGCGDWLGRGHRQSGDVTGRCAKLQTCRLKVDKTQLAATTTFMTKSPTVFIWLDWAQLFVPR